MTKLTKEEQELSHALDQELGLLDDAGAHLELMRTPQGLSIVGTTAGRKVLDELIGAGAYSGEGEFFYAKVDFKEPLTDGDVADFVRSILAYAPDLKVVVKDIARSH